MLGLRSSTQRLILRNFPSMAAEAASVEAQVLDLFASHSVGEIQQIVSAWKIEDSTKLEALKK